MEVSEAIANILSELQQTKEKLNILQQKHLVSKDPKEKTIFVKEHYSSKKRLKHLQEAYRRKRDLLKDVEDRYKVHLKKLSKALKA